MVPLIRFQEGCTPLYRAVENNRYSMTELLMEQFCEVNIVAKVRASRCSVDAASIVVQARIHHVVI